MQHYIKGLVWISIFLLSGCFLFHQPGRDDIHVYSKIFLTDYNTAWQAAIESLKQFERPIQNRQSGMIQTAWTDGTADKIFSDPFGTAETYIKSRYRFVVQLAPGQYHGKKSVKVSIQKELMIQRDVLEGWRIVSSDAISEHTILYRMSRVIANKMRLHRIEEKKIKEVLEEGV